MSQGLRVLIVDDERPIRRFLRTSLKAHGFEIFEAADGEEALGMAAIGSGVFDPQDIGFFAGTLQGCPAVSRTASGPASACRQNPEVPFYP